MKHILYILIFSSVLFSCKKKDEPEPTHTQTYTKEYYLEIKEDSVVKAKTSDGSIQHVDYRIQHMLSNGLINNNAATVFLIHKDGTDSAYVLIRQCMEGNVWRADTVYIAPNSNTIEWNWKDGPQYAEAVLSQNSTKDTLFAESRWYLTDVSGNVNLYATYNMVLIKQPRAYKEAAEGSALADLFIEFFE